MAAYPARPRSAFLLWCQAHLEAFAADPAALGLSEAEVEAFALETAASEARTLESRAARQAALLATQADKDAHLALKRRAHTLVQAIRAHAARSPDPLAVYTAAQILPPGRPSPAPPPARPTGLEVELIASSGELALRWKARNPDSASGTTYIVRRRLPGERSFAFAGITGSKTFVDSTLPAGVEFVEYTVQGHRGQSPGPLSNILSVNIGRLQRGISARAA
jgi:hypothetical protein